MPKGAGHRGRQPTPSSRVDAKKQTRQERGYNYRWEKYRRTFLRNHPLCVRCLKSGRTTVAQHVDHIIPVESATDELFWPPSNHQALCASCHGKKTFYEDKGRGRSKGEADTQWSATLVCGPPCGGKNTYVAERIQDGDLIIDVDAIHKALSGSPTHIHSEQVLRFAFTARDAVVEKLTHDDRFAGHVWIISTAPTRADRAYWVARLRAEVVLLVPDVATCLQRAATERPDRWIGYVRQWFHAYDQDSGPRNRGGSDGGEG